MKKIGKNKKEMEEKMNNSSFSSNSHKSPALIHLKVSEKDRNEGNILIIT